MASTGGSLADDPLTAQEHNTNDLSNGDSDEGNDGDEDNVWSKDIEDAFEDALALYPPCGRRKIILSEEGKMYGRNELIARYIKMRTGKSRSRKQVSSHIQVLARRKQRELSVKLKHCDEHIRKTAMENLATMSSAQIVSATMGINPGANPPAATQTPSAGAQQSSSPAVARIHSIDPAGSVKSEDRGQTPYWNADAPRVGRNHSDLAYDQRHAPAPLLQQGPPPAMYDAYGYNQPLPMHMQGGHMNMNAQHGYYEDPRMAMPGPPPVRQNIPSLSLISFDAMVEYSWGQNANQRYSKTLVQLTGDSFLNNLEYVSIRQIYDKFPSLPELYQQGPRHAFYLVKFWADLDYSVTQQVRENYHMSGRYESPGFSRVHCSSRVCSFGKQVVEKTQLLDYESIGEYRGYMHYFSRTVLCEYMCSFIQKLKQLEDADMMNSVLENFTVLQVFTNADTGAIMLCIAYVFEVSPPNHGPQHHVYRLYDD